MKRHFTRALSLGVSFILAASLFGIPGIALAEEPYISPEAQTAGADELIAASGVNFGASSAVQRSTPDATEAEDDGSYWNIFVTISDTRPFVNRDTAGSPEYTVTLTGDNVGQIPSTKTLAQDAQGGKGCYEDTYLFAFLDGASYTVTVTDSADPYVSYTQTITKPADGKDFEMRLIAGKIETQTLRPSGSIVYGDFNGDNAVDGKDVSKLLDAIEGYSDASYDLLLDGDATNLADLQILAQQLDNPAPTSDNHVAVMLPVNPDADDSVISVSGGTVVSDLDKAGVTPITSDSVVDLVNNESAEKVFVMSSANGEQISDMNPVSMEMKDVQSFLTSDKVITDGPSDDSATAERDVFVSGMRINSSPIGAVSEGFITATYEEDGVEKQITVPFRDAVQDEQASVFALRSFADGPGTEAAYGASAVTGSAMGSHVSKGVITVSFGRLIAVKKVTLTFTKTEAVETDSADAQSPEFNLAALSSVEFLNDTEEFVGAPEMNIPSGVQAISTKGKSFEVSWDRQPNVTGYEISVEAKGAQQVFFVKNTADERQTKTIESFAAGKKGKVENNVEYTVQVQSVNQSWRSGWSDAHKVTPVATKAPTAPEYITAVGKFRSIKVSWKAVEDADTYTIYYRIHGSNDNWSRAIGIENVSHTVMNLSDNTDYDVYLTASNDIGTSGPSAMQTAHTDSINAAKLPEYKLVNTRDDRGRYIDHIAGAALGSTGASIEGNEEFDAAGTNSVMCLFDNNSATYFQVGDWDLGTSYNVGRHGVNVRFDSPQSLGFISFAAAADNVGYSGVAVHYYDEAGAIHKVEGATIVQRDGGNNRRYSLVVLPYEIVTDHIIVGVHRTDGGRGINMAEMHFHGYDSVYHDILGLYEDDTHIQLKRARDDQGNVIDETADQRTQRLKPLMDDLSSRLQTPDPVSGEYFPLKDLAESELAYAYKLLEDENAGLSDSAQLHATISDAYDSSKNLGIGGLNAWQPLGRSVMAGETIVVYVNAPNARGSKSKIDLYVGQNIGESSKAPRRVGTFPLGRTVFTVPSDEFFSTKTTEHGGQLYAQYTGNNPNEQWNVRILGGNEIPVLDLYQVTDENERAARVDTYLTELGEHVSAGNLSRIHNEKDHKAGTLSIGYSDQDCIANATDIMLDKIMFSIPATAAWSASGNGQTDSFLQSLDAYDQMMELFYQHKGLMDPADDAGNPTGATGTDVAPARHLNVRTMTMFTGAFMYAAGNHIGIGFGSSTVVGGKVPVDDTTPGAQGTGTYAGWGLAHEIGHNINDGRYAYAEVTNNYFAQLTRSINTGTTRFKYPAVFEHVTSNPTAHGGGVFTQLAMYWQLMLAYDNHELSALYSTLDQVKANRFFARVDSYARNPSSFTGSVPLTFTSEQQNIIRLASAAAERDLTEFFTAWGFIPDATSRQFMAQFNTENRAIQYADETSAHRNEVSGLAAAYADLSGQDALTASDVTLSKDGSEVTLHIDPSLASRSDIHGFEVTRLTYAAGQRQSEVIGFVQEEGGAYTFTDDAVDLGNRCVSYSICAIDKHLNRSNAVETQQEKLNGNGRLSTVGWSVTTNMDTISVDDPVQDSAYDEEGLECEQEVSLATSAIASIFDSSRGYVGKAASGDPQIIIDMGAVKGVEHLAIEPVDASQAIQGYRLEVKNSEAADWSTVSEGTLEYSDGVAQIYFPETTTDGNEPSYINTENARFIRLTALGKGAGEVSLRAIDVYGPSGDDIELTEVQLEGEPSSIPAVGRLSTDFIYDQGLYESSGHTDGFIKAGSIVFTGSFKGNPAYNTMVLFNDRGAIVGGTYQTEAGEMLRAQQIILAPQPSLGSSFSDTASGRWIYWIEDASELYDGMTIRAELYRVDNAFTNQGQRLVADCAAVAIKPASQLDSITFTSETADLDKQA